jgi:ABC-type multidrug transport system fused ATPase/permease subunit
VLKSLDSRMFPRNESLDTTLQRTLIFAFIALSPIQDFFLRGTALAMPGDSPSLFPLLCLVALALSHWILCGRFRVPQIGMIAGLYAFLLTIYGVLQFGMTFYGQNLFRKSLGSLTILSLFLAAIFIPRYELRGTVRFACYAAFLILVFGLCFSHPTPVGLPGFFDNAVFHYTLIPTLDRPRGLSSEPSFLSVTAISLGLLCAHFSRNRISKAFFVLATLGLLVAIGSKGGILIIFICIGILGMLKFHKWYQLPLLGLLIVPLALIAMIWIPTLFPDEGIAQSGSVQTRASMILCAIETVAHHPFGVGFSGFLPAVSKYLPDSMNSIQAVSPLPLDFSEVSEYLGDSPNTGTKTFLFDQAICFGLPFVLLFLVLTIRLLKRLRVVNNRILVVAVMAVAIAFCSYVSLSGEYATAILIGVAIQETGRKRFFSVLPFRT